MVCVCPRIVNANLRVVYVLYECVYVACVRACMDVGIVMNVGMCLT